MNTKCLVDDSCGKMRNLIIFLWVFILSSISFVSRAESSDVLVKILVPNVIIAKDLMGQSDPKASQRFAESVNLAKTLVVQNPDQIKFQDNVGIILAKALEDGLGSEAALLPMQNLRQEFDADVYLRVKQGIDTIILNILYKSDKWSEGFNIIKEEAERGIVQTDFIANVEGFCSGAAEAGKATEARDTYAYIAKNVSKMNDGRHSPGDCLLRLSHFDTLCNDSVSRLSVLKKIENEHPDYYKKNEPIISYFKFGAYSDLGMQVEAVSALVRAAKTADLLSTNRQTSGISSGISPGIIKSIAKSLPVQLATYKKSGWIDEKLELKIEKSQNGDNVVTNRPARSLTSMMALFLIVLPSAIAFYYIYLHFLKKERL
jgi:hypothetical protein